MSKNKTSKKTNKQKRAMKVARNILHKSKIAIEKFFNLYRITGRRYMTTYHHDLERIGKLSKQYQHRIGYDDEWLDGQHPKLKREQT